MGTKGFYRERPRSQLGFWAMKSRRICWAHLIRKFSSYTERGAAARRLGSHCSGELNS